MSVGTDTTRVSYQDVIANTPISVDMKLFDKLQLQVLYGNVETVAVQDTDYTVAVNVGDNYESFTLTPKPSLLTKINALIAADATEQNIITVVRDSGDLSSFEDTNPLYRSNITKELDRLHMRDAELARMAEDTGSLGLFRALGSGTTDRSVVTKLRDVVSVKDFGAIGDGVTDDTLAFENALIAAKSVFVPVGTYVLADVAMPADREVYGEGPSSLLFLKAQASLTFQPFFRVAGDNVSWRNLAFDGNRSNQPADGLADAFTNGSGKGRSNRSGIMADGEYHGITVENCHFTEMYGASVATRDADRIRISRCRFVDCQYEGAFLTNSNWPTPLDGAEITDCHFENIFTDDAVVQANCNVISGFQNIIVSRNFCTEFERNLVKLENAIQAIVDSNRIENNRLDAFNCLQAQISGFNIRFSNNVIRNCKAGIYINIGSDPPVDATFRNVVIEGNILDNITSDGVVSDGIQVSDVDGLIIRGNVLRDVKRMAIYLPTEFANVTIDNNIIVNSTPDQTNEAVAINGTAGFNHGNVVITNNQIAGKQDETNGIIRINGTATATIEALRIQGNVLFGTGAANNRAIWASEAMKFLRGIISNNIVTDSLQILFLGDADTKLIFQNNQGARCLYKGAENGAVSSVVANGSAAPASGAHRLGDVRWNSLPAASGYMGWVCVAAGTPGTWKGFGAIEP